MTTTTTTTIIIVIISSFCPLMQLMSTLHQMPASGRTVVASIHEPGSSIFACFDDLLLLAEGKVVYFGPASKADDHMRKLGTIVLPATTLRTFLADLISVEYSSPEQEAASRQRIAELAAAWSRQRSSSRPSKLGDTSLAPAPPSIPRVGHLRQVLLQLQRSWRQVSRDKSATAVRKSSSLFSALVFGSIFWRMKRN